MFRKYFLPILVFCFYRTLIASWRLRVEEPEALKQAVKDRSPAVFAIWHGDELIMIQMSLRYPVCTITSTSKDGELMDKVLQFLKMRTTRGSSTRGAVQAFLGLIRLAKKEKRIPVFAVDGPKGPYHQIKPGVFEIARLLRAPIFAAGVASNHEWVFPKSWNKSHLPKFFAKVQIVWSEPVYLDFDQDFDSRSENIKLELEKAFAASQQKALALL